LHWLLLYARALAEELYIGGLRWQACLTGAWRFLYCILAAAHAVWRIYNQFSDKPALAWHFTFI
jgi:hypothetical protein